MRLLIVAYSDYSGTLLSVLGKSKQKRHRFNTIYFNLFRLTAEASGQQWAAWLVLLCEVVACVARQVRFGIMGADDAIVSVPCDNALRACGVLSTIQRDVHEL